MASKSDITDDESIIQSSIVDDDYTVFSDAFSKLSKIDDMDEIKNAFQYLPQDIDVNELLNTIESQQQNSTMFDKTTEQIQNLKNRMLQSIGLERNTLKRFHKFLKNYMYVDEVSDLKYGGYLRWISLDNMLEMKTDDSKDLNVKLTRGAFLVDIVFTDKGISLKMKTVYNTFFHVSFDQNMIFQKLTETDMILLELMEIVK